MQTRLTDLLGCKHPIVQTAMGWVADAGLVGATCEAGGFGFLAAAVMTPEETLQGILAIKTRTDKPFGVNFHMYSPGASDIVDLCIEHGVRAVSYSRSPDSKMVERLKSAGVICMPTVGALKHALKASEYGADAVVVQGSEGGGHTGNVASSILLPQVVAALDIPVVAAGGYHDGRGLVSALAMGAAGVAMGTRFLLTKESPVPTTTKSRYIASSAENIIVSKKLDGMPQRMIKNQCLESLEQASTLRMLFIAVRNGLAFTKMTGDSLLSMLGAAWRMRKANQMDFGQTLMSANAPMMIQEAMVRGHPEQGILPSGQVAGIIEDLPSVAALIDEIMDDASQTIVRLDHLR